MHCQRAEGGGGNSKLDSHVILSFILMTSFPACSHGGPTANLNVCKYNMVPAKCKSAVRSHRHDGVKHVKRKKIGRAQDVDDRYS